MTDALDDNEHPEAEARLRLALARGNRPLDAPEIDRLRERIARNLELARRLSAVVLGNSDETAPDFSPSGARVGDEVVRP